VLRWQVDTRTARAYAEKLKIQSSEIFQVFVSNCPAREMTLAPILVGVIIVREVRP
jgi:hypothetical protein